MALLFRSRKKNNAMEAQQRSLEDILHYRQSRRRIPRYEAYLQTKLFAPHQPYCILRNNFPYVPFHYLMWIHPKYARFYSMERIRAIILARYPHATNIVQNAPHHRSIRSIPHVHFQLEPRKCRCMLRTML